MSPDEYRALLESWQLSLRAERKSPQTLKAYTTGARQFLSWCTAQDLDPNLAKDTVTAFVAHLADVGREAATVRSRQLSVRRFSAWLAEEGEIDRDELVGLKPPKLDIKVIKPLTDEELTALLDACKGKEFRDRRDEALVRFMVECFVRASEAVDMTIGQTSVSRGHAYIVRGKGGKGRSVFFGAQTGRAMDRYLRARRTHRLAGTDRFWLGDRGKGFTYWALYYTLQYRAELAGIAEFNPHRLRNTGATRWLAKGGSEGGLMALAGWATRDMIDRYTAATASERAAEEARSLGLGDL
ncbi:MAG TPA: tyrosine-type recombinase/integrase [Actinophytocola sp.]|uniref:tyrosine-type recombinase/integrase n=1 Tax=Actinophytocola sp. TaxID=1872138 RepID=UPI002DDD90DA|nr:tyrosine-type recombinase/integrase [Actinophytocola sp.]HEV2779112.1 tyrosine-type recombinase/integrase [Actinophytocola sp.]